MRRTVYTRWVIWGILLSSVGCHAGPPVWAAEQTVVHWWHAMRGQLEDAVEALAQQFNASQPTYEVRPVYKGDMAILCRTHGDKSNRASRSGTV
jgi:ABC-type glycerol-3-phosphate transport system substrate-binding protein